MIESSCKTEYVGGYGVTLIKSLTSSRFSPLEQWVAQVEAPATDYGHTCECVLCVGGGDVVHDS